MKHKFTFGKLEFPILLLFLGLFFAVRTANLTSIPVYLDEAIYINWAHLFSLDKNLAYVSMQDGKTPLYFWVVSYFLKIKQNPLIAARMVSVIAGAGTMLASWFMTKVVFGKKAALIFLPLYLLVPCAQFLERMAFADSLLVFLGTLSITIVFAITKLQQKYCYFSGLLGAVFIGIILGLAYLTKSSAKIYLFLTFFILVCRILTSIKKIKGIICLLLFGLTTWAFYSEIITAFRTGASRFFLNIATKEKLLTFSFLDIIKNPLNSIYKTNLSPFIDYFFSYFGITFLGIIFLAVIKIIKKRSFFEMVFLLITIVTGAGIFFTAKSMASRYFLPTVPFLVAIGAKGLEEILFILKNKKCILVALVLTLIIPWAWFDRAIIVSPVSAHLSKDDKSYLFEGQLSGIGIEEVIDYLTKELQKEDVLLAVDSFWGQPDYIELKINQNKLSHRFSLHKFPYFSSSFTIDNTNSDFSEKNCLKKFGKIAFEVNHTKRTCLITVPPEIIEAKKNQKVFLLSLTSRDNQNLILEEKNITLIKKIPRLKSAHGEELVYFYEMTD